MNILVTGAAGFIGSSLCEVLLENQDVTITGVDHFIGPTPEFIKKKNLVHLTQHPRFHFVNEDLMLINWKKYLEEIDCVYHLAGMPGVRASWGDDFIRYVRNNIDVTQRLLEACKGVSLKKFIYTSTSSVYGEKVGKVTEDSKPEPLSPYGITKLTGEYLCHVYRKSFGVPTVILRYFTVYGPRQRSDMAFHRFIKRALDKKPIHIFGDGTQSRDFTFIADCAEATAAVATANNVIGETINIGGKERASILDIISMLESIMGEQIELEFIEKALGEPKHTWADITKAERLLNYQPKIDLKTGLEKEYKFLKSIYGM
ncbi:NAD-dependent epimerase/dehydratase family protein [Halalkalibacter akibai]|uniref:UDP-glucose 4-epimerase n=1 Tax=Halalkalibacter akibai (strain ATCC 43226 / DSM 21942 / CIP 109018 / JCM 9157 / 1139) TaxID=1236973 RepID=W4QWP3_HALA3|nr:NAD-dependent epimerase/dehydratase family protein [Halalkalibacter akibai]GAE36506.1 UDP-glucose 4-epimerase [Halalkalibacter akibai JCM 9157]